MSYDLGKKVALVGFAGRFLLELLWAFCAIFNFAFAGSVIFKLAGILFTLAAAGGFGIMWFDKKNILDLVIAGGIAIVLITYLLHISGTGIIVSILYNAVFNAYLVVWAFKAKDKNIIVAGLLGVAFLFYVQEFLVSRIVLGVLNSNIIYALLHVIVAAIPVFAAFSEEE